MFEKYRKKLAKYIREQTSRVPDIDDGKLHRIPKTVVWLAYFMSLSVLLQGIFDLVIKFLGYTPWFVEFPWRMDFLFLTAVSVLMGYQTFVGIRRRELDVTRNSVQIGLLVEIALVVGDLYFIAQHMENIPEAVIVRMPFVFFTAINVAILIFIIKKLHLFWDEEGNWMIF